MPTTEERLSNNVTSGIVISTSYEPDNRDVEVGVFNPYGSLHIWATKISRGKMKFRTANNLWCCICCSLKLNNLYTVDKATNLRSMQMYKAFTDIFSSISFNVVSFQASKSTRTPWRSSARRASSPPCATPPSCSRRPPSRPRSAGGPTSPWRTSRTWADSSSTQSPRPRCSRSRRRNLCSEEIFFFSREPWICIKLVY